MKQALKALIPTESEEQIEIFTWANLMRCFYPELDLMYHIPNGGARHIGTAKRLKAEGVKAGIPDICLPVARGGYHGLYIELKRVRGSSVSKKQLEIIKQLEEQGYKACVCKGAMQAVGEIKKYLDREDRL